jgi:ABC-type lipoprotein export system ATPase subunit
VDLSDRIRHRPGELSGGQQQRVAIARSMVNRPSLILLDEPTGAVDTETAEQLVNLLQSLNEHDQVTILMVTHDLDVANHAKRMVRLKDGKVVADEPVASVAVAKSSP